jgi:hypothetical protein
MGAKDVGASDRKPVSAQWRCNTRLANGADFAPDDIIALRAIKVTKSEPGGLQVLK